MVNIWAVVAVTLVLGNQVKNGESNVYSRLSVPSSVIDGVTSESVNIISEILCALKTKRSLFCFKKETGVCTSYDKRLPSNYEAVDDGNPKISCYTNEKEGCFDGNLTLLEGETLKEDTFEATCSNKTLTKKCVYDGYTYLEGATREENCTRLTCTRGTWAPEDFKQVNGTGSIAVLHVPKDFEGAKQCCQGMGAQLVIPDDFKALQQYLNSYYSWWFYVGFYNQTWINGVTPEADQWRSGVPEVGYDCAVIESTYGWTLVGVSCTALQYFICQKV